MRRKTQYYFLKVLAITILTLYLSFATYEQERMDLYLKVAVIGYLILGLYLLIMIWKGYQRNSPLILSPSWMFLFAYFLYFPWSGIDTFIFNRGFQLVSNQEWVYLQMMFLSWTGILGFQIGYGKPVPKSLVRRDLLSDFSDQLNKFNLLPLTVSILVFIGVGGYFGNLIIGGGFTYLFQNFLKWAVFLLFMVCLIHPNPLNVIVLVLIGSIFFALQWAEVTGNRSETLIPLLGIISLSNIFQYKKSKYPKSNLAFLLGTAVIILSVFVVASQVRFHGEINVLSLNSLYDFSFQYFNGFESSMIMLSSVPNKIDFLGGKTFFAALYQFIPSAIWPAKPLGYINADSWFTYLIMGIDPKQTLAIPPILAELYWNFGFWFVGVGMIFVGALFKCFDRLLYRTKNIFVLIFIASITSISLHFVRGPFGNYVTRVVYEFIPFVFVLLMFNFTQKRFSSKSPNSSQSNLNYQKQINSNVRTNH